MGDMIGLYVVSSLARACTTAVARLAATTALRVAIRGAALRSARTRR